MIKAVLFDMDGVLVDSEQYICQAAIQMFREHGLNVRPDDFTPFVGKGENRYLGGVAEKYNFLIDIERDKARTYAIYEEITRGKLAPLPGVHDFLKACKKRKLKIAVATSADYIKMHINLQSIGLNEEYFDATVNGLEVEHKKPAPDIFLAAAKKMAVDPTSCLVVEDAVSGVQAAKAAGARCLALTTSFSEKDLVGADWITQTLATADMEVLEW